jgi:hypothetical protein
MEQVVPPFWYQLIEQLGIYELQEIFDVIEQTRQHLIANLVCSYNQPILGPLRQLAIFGFGNS